MENETLRVRNEELEDEVKKLTNEVESVPALREENTVKVIEIEQLKGKVIELTNELELEKKAAEAHGVSQELIDEQSKKF